MQEYFYRLADALKAELAGEEVFTATFDSEDSDFVRFNKSEVRQAGHVTQHALALDLINGPRHAAGSMPVCGDFAQDQARAKRLVADLRVKYPLLPEDPYLLYATDVQSSEQIGASTLPGGAAAVAEIQKAGQGRDLVGIYAAGGIHRGFANSFGQRNWYSTYSFNFDWSFYRSGDKAVKATYAGFKWEPAEFERKTAWACEQLDVIAKPPKTIKPGRYKVYLAPAAVYDLLGLLGWDCFGLKAHRTKQTPLLKMVEGDTRLNPAVAIAENTRDGVAPNFQEAGFLRPERVALIDNGTYHECLVSPRSSREYGVPTNGASALETPQSVELAAGALPSADVLKKLGTGIYVSNLWYLNYSDRNTCRATGMTRFATLWVEHGDVQGPLNVMRFDESLFRALGQNLVALTAERELVLDTETYFARSTRSGRVPGALIEDFTLTL